MKAQEFDERFDHGEDISKYLEMSGARRPIIKVWIAARLESIKKS